MFDRFKILKSLRARIFVSFSIISFLLILAFAIYFVVFTLDHIIELDKLKVEKTADEFSLKLSKFVNSNITIAKSTAISLENFEAIDETERRETFNNLLLKTLENNENITAIWVRFKPYTIDNLDYVYENTFNGISGQYVKTYYKEQNHIVERPPSLADEEKFLEFISTTQQNKRAYIFPHLENEYLNTYVDKSNMIRFIVPVYNQNKLIGIVGLDVDIQHLNNIISAEKEKYAIYLLSNKERFIIHPDKKILDYKITDAYPYIAEDYKLLKNLREADKFIENGRIFNEDHNFFYVFDALELPVIDTKWNIIVSISEQKLYAEKRERTFIIIILASLLFAGNLFFFYLLSNAVANALNSISDFLEKISQGRFDYKNKLISTWTSSELKSISTLTEKMKQGLQQTSDFANEISKGNFENEFQPLSEDDNLGKSLIDLKKSLIENEKREQKQRQEQEERNWTNAGITKFGEILRININNIDSLSYEIISQLCEYVGAVQGGFFIYNARENQKDFLELKAFYSYNRKIYKLKKIALGDGLVGTCALEKKPINMNLPDDYLEINTGLGQAKPRFLIISPLIYNDEIMGVIEMTSLHEFTETQKQFIYQISGTVASSLETVKINQQTVKLLQDSQKQSEEMARKEAELKQNIQKLEDIQKESVKNEMNMRGFMNSLNRAGQTAEFDIKTKVISINNQLLDTLKTTYQEATTKNYYELLNVEIDELDIHQNYWRKIKDGEVVKFLQKIPIGKKDIWLDIILSPIYYNDEKIAKVLMIAFDHTKIQKQRIEIEKLVAETQEKAEQLKIQEQDMEFTYQELEKMYAQIDELTKEIEKVNAEKEASEKRVALYQKELEKRVKRSQKIEKRLKERNNELLKEIKKLSK